MREFRHQPKVLTIPWEHNSLGVEKKSDSQREKGKDTWRASSKAWCIDLSIFAL